MSWPGTVASFIQQKLRDAYANETIVDAQGNPFVVREVSFGSDMDGASVCFYDRHSTTSLDWYRQYGGFPYDVEKPRMLSLFDTAPMPPIVNLALDKKAKVWTPILPRHERGDKADPLNHP